MSEKYILTDAGEPIAIENTLEWAKWFEANEAKWSRQEEIGPYSVTTMFAGVNLDIRGQMGAMASGSTNTAPPLLWETVILGSSAIITQERCHTWEEARKQHDQALELARRAIAYPKS